MRRHLESAFVVSLALAIGLTGCAGGASPLVAPTIVATPAATAASPTVTASAQIVPATVAEMRFLIAAPVKQVAVKEGEVVRAGQTLIVLDAPDLEYAQTAAQEALKSAQSNEFIQSSGRRTWNGRKNVWLTGPPELRQVAVAKTLQAQAGLEEAQAELSQAVLVAPFDGTVVSIKVLPGEVVQPDAVALVIGDLNHLRLETTDLSERVVAQLRIGQTARIRLKAYSQELTGKVSAIAPIAGLSSDGDTVYKVTIELDQQPAGLLWGMTGDVEIQVR